MLYKKRFEIQSAFLLNNLSCDLTILNTHRRSRIRSIAGNWNGDDRKSLNKAD